MKKWLNSLTFKERIAISYGFAGLAVVQTFIEIIPGEFLPAIVGIFTFLFSITLTLIAQHQNWFRSPKGTLFRPLVAYYLSGLVFES